MTEQDKRELEQLRAENAALKAKASQGLGLTVGNKGGICVTGLGSFPTTLYYEQWVKVLAMADQIHAFAKANEALIQQRQDNPIAPTAAQQARYSRKLA